MGNVSLSCCRSKSPRTSSGSNNYRNGSNAQYSITNQSYGRKLSIGKGNLQGGDGDLHHQSNNLQHISEREPDDSETDPSSNPFNRPIFAARSSYTRNRTGSNSYYNDSYSSNNSNSRRLLNTPLTSSQDHGYNSGASTNLTSQYGSQLNDSFENSLQNTRNITNNVDTNKGNSNPRTTTTKAIAGDHYNVDTTDSGAKHLSGDINNSDTNRLLLFSSPTTSDDDNVKIFQGGDFSSAIENNHQNLQSQVGDDHIASLGLGPRDISQQQQLQKSSSCSTIYIDDSTISQPNLRQTIKCVSLAIYYHIKNRTSDDCVEIFDESLHPLRMPAPNTPDDSQEEFGDASEDDDGDLCNGLDRPNQKTIYSFVKTLFKAAQLTSEYAITTLVYLERLMTYAEMDLTPRTWRRMFLGAILLSSKVWEDQAVWNVDYAQILEDISVEDINELERQFLELIQFNMNVPSSVYAKYYFHLRTLSLKNGLSEKYSLLSVGKARTLEAMSRVPVTEWQLSPIHRKSSPTIKRHTSLEKLRLSGQAKAVLM